MILTSSVSFAQTPEFDVLIVGAGMVGSALAAALAQTSLRVGVIEARDRNQGVGPDGRASALALGTVWMFDQLGAWSLMRMEGVSPIRQIWVSDADHPRRCCLNCEEIQQEALGFIVENRVTLHGLGQIIDRAPNIQVIAPAQVRSWIHHSKGLEVELQDADGGPMTVTAQLLVGADGSRSRIREQAGIGIDGWGYGQVCLVTTVTTEKPHEQVAYERFQAQGPFAILPMTEVEGRESSHRSCVVWTIPADEREQLMSLPDPDFIRAMTPAFGSELGEILAVTPRACYEPRRQHSRSYIGPRLALVGDAAHSTHPVGGQGVNMGMRDVAALGSLLLQAQEGGEDLGNWTLLNRYQRSRRWENQSVLLATDLANRMFSNRALPLQWSRRLSLAGLDRMLWAKQLLMRQAMGIAPYHPRLSWTPIQVSPASAENSDVSRLTPTR